MLLSKIRELEKKKFDNYQDGAEFLELSTEDFEFNEDKSVTVGQYESQGRSAVDLDTTIEVDEENVFLVSFTLTEDFDIEQDDPFTKKGYWHVTEL